MFAWLGALFPGFAESYVRLHVRDAEIFPYIAGSDLIVFAIVNKGSPALRKLLSSKQAQTAVKREVARRIADRQFHIDQKALAFGRELATKGNWLNQTFGNHALISSDNKVAFSWVEPLPELVRALWGEH